MQPHYSPGLGNDHHASVKTLSIRGSSSDPSLVRCLLLPALPYDSAYSVALQRFALEHPANAVPLPRDASGRDMAEHQGSREGLRETAEAWHTLRRVPCLWH